MSSAYKSEDGRRAIQYWCCSQLDSSPTIEHQWDIDTEAGRTHVVAAGPSAGGSPTFVVIPGTNMNSAVYLPFLASLAVNHRVICADVPGQPGLSAPTRQRRHPLIAHGHWLTEVLEQTVPDAAILIGHSLGGAIALSCTSSKASGRLLVAPAGLVRLAISRKVLAATIAWLVDPTPMRSYRLLRPMTAPGLSVAPPLIKWMTLVAQHCRTTLAPAPLPQGVLATAAAQSHLVVTGEHDVFLPPERLTRAVRDRLGTDLQVISGCGHLALHDQPAQIARLALELTVGS
jgi:pimeloyl-ACP methyl ester carboxylesterase